MYNMNVSELIRQAVANENHNFRKVILNVAVGLKGCGFFDKEDWRKTLEQCFEQTSTEMKFDSTELWDVDSSYEITFANILAESTPSTSVRAETGKRVKRSSTLLYEDDSLQDTRKRLKKSPKLRHDDDKVANILADLKEANWREIVPTINDEQTVQYENVFERAKRIREAETSCEVSPSSNLLPVALQTVSEPVQNEMTICSSIKKRRYAIYLPSPKKRAVSSTVSDVLPVPVSELVANISENENSINADTSNDTLREGNVTLTNKRKRRTVRSKIRPMAAYSDVCAANITELQVIYFPRTSVLFTMIDSLQYQNTLSKYNIAVAYINDNYDYVIAERICCSPEFLTAVVSGRPIVSIEWIHDLSETNVWLDPLNYLLKDDNGEKEYNFDLAVTQRMARSKRLFENYSILVTPHIDADLRGVVLSGGGRFLQTNVTATSADEILCVSDETDKQMWPKLQRKYPNLKRIISLDGFLKMIFQYTHDINMEDVFYPI
ncbi:uncharacterized protein LOC119080600 [Bradysia coprophila]|uniref:uncharacterized protein LOC119080600 n=1 Tax=Bradysia coprophila TaxID=38358 RepID=UPI00187D9B53|nr:uncharacterized protein LOC119080600 [Bradysia coprophila]XP_037044904.1 uncharacterized protein LOC119080600 [Bradysia coprophila]